MRRTTTLDIHPAVDGSLALVGRARDLLTGADSSTEVLDHALLRLGIGPDVRVTSASAHPSDVGPLVGRPAVTGFRTAVWRSLRPDYDAGTPLHQLLDDVPGAMVISGLTARRVRKEPPGPTPRPVDVCVGWSSASAAVRQIEITGKAPPLWNPPAPHLPGDDPVGSHTLPALPVNTMRRARRLDVWRDGAHPGQSLAADVGHRDTLIAEDGSERVLHEYRLTVAVDAHGVVTRCEATAHVLPHLECPSATLSALRVVGMPVARLRESVSAEFFGPTTCTHLNDMLRGLTDLPTLASALG